VADWLAVPSEASRVGLKLLLFDPNHFSLFQKHAFVFKMWFFSEMRFHFQSVKIFENVKGFVIVFFVFSKNTIVNKHL
jgi:hypothetical protein